MMKGLTRFDRYYQQYFKPQGREWEKKDFERLKKWYFAWLKKIEKRINLKAFKKRKVLEIGGGVGAFASLLQERGFEDVLCSDISSKALALAKKFNPQLKTILLDIEDCQPQTRYALVFAFEVLEHLNDYQKGVKNIFNLLEKRGSFIGSTPYPFAKNLQDPTHQNVFFPSQWEKIFRKAGFRRVMTSPMSFPPLLYRLNKHFNFCLPFYLKNKYFVSTSLIIAQK